jgi:hypothetical protein
MSLRACPKCGRPVLTFARFLLEPLYIRSRRCSGCSAALTLDYGYRVLPASLGIILLYFGLAALLKSRLPTFPAIPFIVGIGIILLFFLSLKGTGYLLAEWRVEDAGPR